MWSTTIDPVMVDLPWQGAWRDRGLQSAVSHSFLEPKPPWHNGEEDKADFILRNVRVGRELRIS